MASIQGLHHVSVPMPRTGHDDARRFYGEVLGLTQVAPPSSLGVGSVVWFRVGESGSEVHCFVDEPFRTGCPDQHLCLQVDDLEAFRARLGEHGVTIDETIGIQNRPRLFVNDPFGNRVEITEIRGQYS